jgi:hypothetical protein
MLACAAGREAGEEDVLKGRIVAGYHVSIIALPLSAVPA